MTVASAILPNAYSASAANNSAAYVNMTGVTTYVDIHKLRPDVSAAIYSAMARGHLRTSMARRTNLNLAYCLCKRQQRVINGGNRLSSLHSACDADVSLLFDIASLLCNGVVMAPANYSRIGVAAAALHLWRVARIVWLFIRSYSKAACNQYSWLA